VFSQLFFLISFCSDYQNGCGQGSRDMHVYRQRWILIQIHTTLTVVHPGWKKIVLMLLSPVSPTFSPSAWLSSKQPSDEQHPPLSFCTDSLVATTDIVYTAQKLVACTMIFRAQTTGRRTRRTCSAQASSSWNAAWSARSPPPPSSHPRPPPSTCRRRGRRP
jgi:hypothetical protein